MTVEELAKELQEHFITVQHNTFYDTVAACGLQWGMAEMIEGKFKWKEEYKHIVYPPIPKLNLIKKI